jgi:hypothetical protein
MLSSGSWRGGILDGMLNVSIWLGGFFRMLQMSSRRVGMLGILSRSSRWGVILDGILTVSVWLAFPFFLASNLSNCWSFRLHQSSTNVLSILCFALSSKVSSLLALFS